MSLRVGSTVINCANIDKMTALWSRVLSLSPDPISPHNDFRVLRGPPVNMSLQLARSPVMARDQMHLDLYADDKTAEVERVVALGATWVRSSNKPDDDYDVLSDPKGNEFCICTFDARVGKNSPDAW